MCVCVNFLFQGYMAAVKNFLKSLSFILSYIKRKKACRISTNNLHNNKLDYGILCWAYGQVKKEVIANMELRLSLLQYEMSAYAH